MILLVLGTVILALAVGYGVKYLFDNILVESEHEITWQEFAIGAAVIVFLVAPFVGVAGYYIARDNVLTYHESWNGWELATRADVTVCHRDGSCSHCYDCDPYYVSQTCYTHDSKGNTTGSYECGSWHYHSCPYVDEETSYYVDTTLGSYAISVNRFPDDPQSHRWRSGHDIPDFVIERAGTGIPEFWAHAKWRVDSGRSGPVTVRKSYDNYLLASDSSILRAHSPDIARYLKQKLLPPTTSDIHDFYLSDRVHFVGMNPGNASEWQNRLGRLNAALGSELQGDLQIVIVRSALVDDKDTYALALKAYWQDPKVFAKESFSKNGIAVVIGTNDGNTVAWSRAFTGMPVGNEEMVVALENGLKGTPLRPDAVIGMITTSFGTKVSQSGEIKNVVLSKHTGAIASILWGDREKVTRFTRIGMTGKGTGAGSGYLYLNSEIGPTTGQEVWIAVIIFILSCGVWTGAAVAGTRFWRN